MTDIKPLCPLVKILYCLCFVFVIYFGFIIYVYIFLSFVKKSVPGSLARESRDLTDMGLTKRKMLICKLSRGQNGDQKLEEKLNKNRSLQAFEMRHNSQCIRMDSGLWTVWWTDRV